jgi:hypothetical protein
VLAALLAAGCSQPTRPAWVDQPGASWPDAFYLTAVGAGSSRDQAADAALARLSQRIAVEVEARETTQSTYVADTGSDEHTSRERVQMDRRIDLDTDTLLMGSKVQETWRDPEGPVYALAVLDRLAAASAYDDMLRDLADQVRAAQAESDAAGSAWSRFVRLGRALAPAREHDRLLRIRAAISPWSTNPFDEAPEPLAPEVAAERAAALVQLIAVVDLAPGTPEAFAPIVTDALMAAGIAVSPDAEPSVRARVAYEASERPFARRTDHVVEWRVTVQLVDGRSGRSAQELTLEGDGWGETAADASAAAMHRARSRLRPELTEYILDLVSPADTPARADRGDGSKGP